MSALEAASSPRHLGTSNVCSTYSSGIKTNSSLTSRKMYPSRVLSFRVEHPPPKMASSVLLLTLLSWQGTKQAGEWTEEQPWRYYSSWQTNAVTANGKCALLDGSIYMTADWFLPRGRCCSSWVCPCLCSQCCLTGSWSSTPHTEAWANTKDK